MEKELIRAQKSLNEEEIRKAWRDMMKYDLPINSKKEKNKNKTQDNSSRFTENQFSAVWSQFNQIHPRICRSLDGIVVDFNREITDSMVSEITRQLLTCRQVVHVGAPFFEYNYDLEDQEQPHHMAAITLTKYQEEYYLGLFNPKGKESLTLKKEKILFNRLAADIKTKTNVHVYVRFYQGKNLQKKDTIGNCQLYSLFFLFRYVQGAVKIDSRLKDSVLIDPNKIIDLIHEECGDFDTKLLHRFFTSRPFFAGLKK